MLFGFGFAIGGLFFVVFYYGFRRFVWKETPNDNVDIKRMWILLNKSNAETMQLKLFRNEEDAKPYRSIIFVEGIEAVEKLSKFIEDMSGETYTSPRIKA